jgi:chromosome segregation ATPase
MVPIKNVRLEVYRDGRIPDVVCQVGREEYYVEVTNTHEIPSDKIVEFRRQGRSALELVVDSLDSSSYLESYDDVKVQLTALNPLNPIWDLIEYQAAVSINRERSELLRKVAKHRKQVQRISKSIPEREGKAQRKVERLERKVAEWQEREAYHHDLYKQIALLVEGLQTAVERLNHDKTVLSQELEFIQSLVAQKKKESEQIISNARQKMASEYDQQKRHLTETILAELEEEVTTAKKNADAILNQAKEREAEILSSAKAHSQDIEAQARFRVEHEVNIALEQKELSKNTLNELESSVVELQLEVGALQAKKAQLEERLNLDHLLTVQRNASERVDKLEAQLEDIKALGNQYVKLINEIAIDLKSVSTSDYFELLPERVQKKMKANRMILEMQSSIEYEPV